MGRQSETKFSIKSDGDQMTPINVHRTTPKVMIENISETDNLTLNFNQGKTIEKLTSSSILRVNIT